MVQKGPDRGLGSLRLSRGGVAIIHRVRLGGCFVFVFDNHKYSSLTPHARLSMRTESGKKKRNCRGMGPERVPDHPILSESENETETETSSCAGNWGRKGTRRNLRPKYSPNCLRE